MKPYQFYVVRAFPALKRGDTVGNKIQLTFSGEGEDVETSLTLEDPAYEDHLGWLRVKSAVKHETLGFIKTVIENRRQQFNFSEYLQPVDFSAFLDGERKVVIFQASKKICRGVIGNLRSYDQINLVEMTVDFAKVMDQCREYLAAWFRGVSPRVHSAGLSGDQIQDDSLFKKLLKVGELSNVTIPWFFEAAEHKIMVTSSGAIVLVQDYKANQGLELRLVLDVYDKLLSKVWEEKKSRRWHDDSPGAP